MKKIVAVCMVLALCLSCAALADESELVVNGTGVVYMQADQASATLGVSINGEDLAELQTQANETVLAICEALKQAGLDEKNISTNSIYMYPRYDYSGEIERIVGYSITNSLTIRTDEMDRIGAYIDAAFAAGANTFDSINFTVKDDREERDQALRLAVEDARAKAEVIAAASGQTLGQVLEIREGSDESSYYYNDYDGGMRFAVTEDASSAGGTTVRAAQVSVSAKVQISYELK